MAKKTVAVTAGQREFLERRVWNYCRTPDEQNQNAIYIHRTTTFEGFKGGKVTDLSFHLSGLAADALATEIELFAAHLHQYLDLFNISPIADPGEARGKVREAAADTALDMQTLLDAVVDNYREN